MEGLGLAMLVLFPFVLLRAFGYGDWKLVGASGAILAVEDLWTVFFVAAVVNALIALGMVIGLLLMMPGHVIGATGAGDVKLMAAVGAVVGTGSIVRVFLYTAVAGGVFAA